MKPIYYIIIVDFILLLLCIKLIFGNISVFTKAILGHVFSDFDDFLNFESFKKWDKENDIKHKMNLLYAAILALLGGTFLLYTQAL